MSYLNEPLTLAQKRELLKTEGMVLSTDLELINDSYSFKKFESDSEVQDFDILWGDDFDKANIRPSDITTLASFLKWKTKTDQAHGERKKEEEIKSAIKLLSGMGIKGINY